MTLKAWAGGRIGVNYRKGRRKIILDLGAGIWKCSGHGRKKLIWH